MDAIDITGIDPISTAEASSKGNQPKWFIDGCWYKADHMGYEALAETVISRLLQKTNITGFVSYSPVFIKNGSKTRTGCKSRSFREKNTEIITLEKLYRAYEGVSLSKALTQYTDAEDKLRFTVDFAEKHTGLENAGRYFTAMLELDAFFLNEDRHTNNIAFVRNADTGVFSVCPFFDFGLSLLSDLNDYAPEEDIYSCINRVEAKPFDVSFDIQTEAAENLYGQQLAVYFTESDIHKAVFELSGFYPENILIRAENILRERLRKFAYLKAQKNPG